MNVNVIDTSVRCYIVVYSTMNSAYLHALTFSRIIRILYTSGFKSNTLGKIFFCLLKTNQETNAMHQSALLMVAE